MLTHLSQEAVLVNATDQMPQLRILKIGTESNVAIPFIDHIITELDSQFSGLAKAVSTLLGLVPLNIHTNEVIDLTEI